MVPLAVTVALGLTLVACALGGWALRVLVKGGAVRERVRSVTIEDRVSELERRLMLAENDVAQLPARWEEIKDAVKRSEERARFHARKGRRAEREEDDGDEGPEDVPQLDARGSSGNGMHPLRGDVATSRQREEEELISAAWSRKSF